MTERGLAIQYFGYNDFERTESVLREATRRYIVVGYTLVVADTEEWYAMRWSSSSCRSR